MFRNFIYLNIIFIFGLFLYLVSQKFDLELQSFFYLFFSLSAVTVPLLFIFNLPISNLEKEGPKSFTILFSGFAVYGVANFLWYLDDVFKLTISLELINLLFIFQIITKNLFFYLESENLIFLNLRKILAFNILVLLIALFLGQSWEKLQYFLEIYFILESLLTLLVMYYFAKSQSSLNTTHMDIKYFVFGTIMWFLADSLFLLETITNTYFMGNYSDFIYFIGFYLMLGSFVFKNISLNEKFITYFEKNLSFS